MNLYFEQLTIEEQKEIDQLIESVFNFPVTIRGKDAKIPFKDSHIPTFEYDLLLPAMSVLNQNFSTTLIYQKHYWTICERLKKHVILHFYENMHRCSCLEEDDIPLIDYHPVECTETFREWE